MILINILKLEECRARILKDGGLKIAGKFINHKNDEIRFEVYRFMFNLN